MAAIGRQAFRNRLEAGRELADWLGRHRESDATVLGLARGGVPVAYEVARELRLPLDVFVVRKLGLPEQPELAMGAVASDGTRVLNEDVLPYVDDAALENVLARESAEVARRERAYRGDRGPLDVRGRAAILVDDGLATGASMLAAVRALRGKQARAVVVAVPIAPRETCEAISAEVDEIVCVHTPRPFHSVGAWYENFTQTSDEEVRRLIDRAAQTHPPG